MSITLQAAPAHRQANSYVSFDEANDYFDERQDCEGWTGETDGNQKRALIFATNLVDTYRFFGTKYDSDQRLKHPRNDTEEAGGTADSGSATSVVDSSFANNEQYNNESWVYGSILVTEGTNENEIRQITAFDVSTGTFTTDAFSNAIDSTSQFTAIEEVPRAIKQATCEIALWLIERGYEELKRDQSVKSASIGELSETFRDKQFDIPLPAFAESLLKGYINRTGRIV